MEGVIHNGKNQENDSDPYCTSENVLVEFHALYYSSLAVSEWSVSFSSISFNFHREHISREKSKTTEIRCLSDEACIIIIDVIPFFLHLSTIAMADEKQ